MFLKSRITTLPMALDLHWDAPPSPSINGEFLGYVLTYRPLDIPPDQAKVTSHDMLIYQEIQYHGLAYHGSNSKPIIDPSITCRPVR